MCIRDSPEAVQRILDAFDNIIEVINRMIEWAVWAAKTIVNTDVYKRQA